MTVDPLDRQLVELLGADGRRTFVDLAAETGVSEATVRARIQRLTSTGTLRIVALCNPLTLGHQSARILLTVRDLLPRNVARELAAHPAIGHVALVTGVHDIYLEAATRDLDQLAQLMDLIRRTPGVASIDQLILTRLYKDYSWDGLRDQSGHRAAGNQTAPVRTSDGTS